MSTDPHAIVRRSLHDELVARLRDMIVDGALKAGQKIPEAELCAKFAVSRTPMREAMKVLASEGLLTLLPNRGALVARITAEEIEELFPIMGAMEGLAGELAAKRFTPAAIAALRRDHDRMLRHYERRDWVGYSKLNRAIHEAIFAAAGNGALSAMYMNLLIRIHHVRFVARPSDARWRQAVEDHEKIIAAVEARDARKLSRILVSHLRNKADMVIESLKRGGAGE